jgi:alpha-D-ribose 1-methylphosphonate 5-triphosphate synthase subunit PhnG
MPVERHSKTRAAHMRTLALAPWPELDRLTRAVCDQSHSILRGPEVGLVMLRGRMGGSGAPFNFGEATVTRCTARLDDGTEGHAYVLGRNGEHAKRAALCDALLQTDKAEALYGIIAALEGLHNETRAAEAAKVAATKVDFFTLVRGDV